MITCPHCGRSNPEGTLFCEECGEPFVEGRSEPTRAIGPQEAPASRIPESITLRVQGADRQFAVEMLDAPVILGRTDPEAGYVPEIELTPYNAVQLGVSRRHAMISWSADGVTVEDLDSYNGTLLNGRRLSPHSRWLLRDGDEITLGELVLRVYFD